MFDFKDFMTFMAINDAMEEEENNSSPKYSSRSSDEPVTTGGKIAVVGTIIGIVLGLVFESWLCFIFFAAAGFIIGLNHDVYKSTEDKKKSDKI
ncbi:MAG: hypothetical protein J5720_03975 [Bacteroidaceae bacterium]|nr:hypothetical protein [Bacteroidaceae bacterium]